MVTMSAAGLALQRHVIPLILQHSEHAEGTQVLLAHYMDVRAGNKEKHKYNVPLVSMQDVETICRCVLEFNDVLAPQRLFSPLAL